MKANTMKPHFFLSLLMTLLSAPLWAASATIEIEIPQLQVAEYHRPYIALWIEDENKKTHAQLAVWYDIAMKNDEGKEWLKDLRQWWRRGGRNLDLPVDGVSSATRPVGKHRVQFDTDHPALQNLKPGKYLLFAEASREVGGREVVKIPFQWPPKEQQSLSVKGERELGAVILTLQP